MWVYLGRINYINVNIYILYACNFLLNIIYYLYVILLVEYIFDRNNFN